MPTASRQKDWISIKMDPELKKWAKALAADDRRTLNAYLNIVLEDTLGPRYWALIARGEGKKSVGSTVLED